MLRALALAVLVAALAGCSEADIRAAGAGVGREVRVQRVVDGDTLVIAGGERVRLIGIDTPETKKPGSPVECFGRRASAFTERLVEGRRVRLVRDVEERDRFGRLLAYVYRGSDDLFVNAELVRRGYATPATFPPNVRYAERFARLGREARQANRGLWSACG